MPNPYLLAAFGASSLLSAFSAYQQAEIQNRLAAYSASAARLNADLARRDGDFAFKAALKDEKKHRDQLQQFIGSQRARMGASGFSVESASFEDTIDTSAVLGELDALAIRYEGELAQWRAQQEARLLEFQADVAETTKTSPFLAAGTSLLGSGARGISFFGRN